MGAPAGQETGILSRAAAREQLTEMQTNFKVWEALMLEKEYGVEAKYFKTYFIEFVDSLLECLSENRATLPPYEMIIDFIKNYVDMARRSRPRLRRNNGEEWRDMAEELNQFVVMMGLLPIDFGPESIEEIEISSQHRASNTAVAEGA
jgi:hypothetical protein